MLTLPFDDAGRPRAPEHPGAPVTPRGRVGAQQLQGIHDHLRHELAHVERVVAAAALDARRAADARALVQDLSMGVNYAALGSFCGRYCSVVDVHHRIEDAAMFPDLAAADAELQPVLDRLSQEHVAVHGALVELDQALVAMVEQGAPGLPRVQEALGVLSQGLLSHLDYEERELLPAIARLGLLV